MSFIVTVYVLASFIILLVLLCVFLFVVRRRWFARFEKGYFITLVLAIAGPAIGSTILLGLWGYEVSEQLFVARVESELADMAAIVERQIREDLQEAFAEMERRGAIVDRELLRTVPAFRERLERITMTEPRFLQMDVFDSNGNRITGSRQVGAEPSARVDIAYALDGTRYASEPYFSEVWGNYVVNLVVPIRVAEGQEILGALSSHYDFDAGVSALLSLTRFGDSGYSVIADATGRILAHPNPERIHEDISSYPAVQKAIEGESGSLLAPNRSGELRFWAYQPFRSPATVNPTNLALLTEMRQDEAVAPLLILREEFGVALVVLFIIGLVTAQQLAGGLSRPISELGEVMRRVQGGDFTQEPQVSGKDIIGRLQAAIRLMIAGLRERDKVKELFGRYVTTQVSQRVLQGAVNLGGESRRVTILFSDIRGFTAMSETMRPAQVVALLNAYFSEMVEAVFEHNGVLDKFIGDAIMAVFGSFEDTPDHPHRAVRAALRMQALLAKINGERAMQAQPPLSIGIGIHTDEVIVGNIGSHRRLEYTVIGDGVNISSRVESLNKEFSTTILITEATYNEVKDEFECRLMPEKQLRGKSQPMRFYEVVSLKPPASGPSRGQVG